MTIADEIIHNSQYPEKTSPGVATYNIDKSHKKILPEATFSPKVTDRKYNYFDESVYDSTKTPAAKYKAINLNLIRNKDPSAHFRRDDSSPRFPKLIQNTPTGPGSYEIADSFRKTHLSKTNIKFGKYKPESFVTTAAKKKISPGPAQHSPETSKYNMLSKSSLISTRRH